jgi:outer membrane protein assembly factor BamB
MNRPIPLVAALLGLILLPALTIAAEVTNIWPQWRGPTRDGQVAGLPWPNRLTNDSLELLWRVPLGPSYSGPIVSDDLVFTTETRNRAFEVVYALDRKTGKERWHFGWKGSISVPFFAASNGSWIRSTPAYDGQFLYVAGMRDVLICLEAATGKQAWLVDFVQGLKTPLPAFGFVCSPLIDGDALYVQAGASVVRMDKHTGKIVWRTLKDSGGMSGSAFSSPVLATLGGKRQLVVQTREALAGIDPDSGTALWSRTIPAFQGMNILTPTIIGDSIFTSTYTKKSILFHVGQNNSRWAATETWNNKAQGYLSTPVVVDGHVYIHLQSQRFACIDLATGRTNWTSEPFGKYCSLVAQGHKILALDQRGILILFKANPEKFELLGSRKMSDDETWAHLSVAADQLFIRELNAMAVYRWKPTGN